MKTAMRKYVRKRLKRIRKALKALKRDADQKHIHRVRVEIKKIRALFRLLRYANPDFRYRNTYKPFKKVFKQCAKLRDPHVLREISKGLTGTDDTAPDDTTKHLKKFRSKLPRRRRKTGKQKKGILKAAKSVDDKTYRRFIRKKEDKLRQMLVKDFDQAPLHYARKVLKDILYLRQIKEKSKSIPAFYEAAASILGDWHDKQILASRLRMQEQSDPALMDALLARSRDDLNQLKEMVDRHYS